MYEGQEDVSLFVDMAESVPVEVLPSQDHQQQEQSAMISDIQQEDVVIDEDLQTNHQQNDSSDVEYSGMSDVGGDGNSTMDEDGTELKHVVEAYGDISPHEEEFDSVMSEIASVEGETKAADDTIRAVIEGYDDISSADKFSDTLNADKVDDSNKSQQETVLVETEMDRDNDILSPRTQDLAHDSGASIAEEKVEEQQIDQDEEVWDPIAVTNDDATHGNNQEETSGSHDNQPAINIHGNEMQRYDDQAATMGSHGNNQEASGSHDNQPSINIHGNEMQRCDDQAATMGSHDDKMEEISGTGNKRQERKKDQAGSTGAKGDIKKKFSPFAFVAKQSKKALSWQKFRGTDDSLHKNEHMVGPVDQVENYQNSDNSNNKTEDIVKEGKDMQESKDVAGPTSVSRGDNVIDMFDGLVPDAVLRHNANKRRLFKPTVPVRRPFRKKQKLTVVTDVISN